MMVINTRHQYSRGLRAIVLASLLGSARCMEGKTGRTAVVTSGRAASRRRSPRQCITAVCKRAALFVSDKAGFIAGSTLAVNGGQHLI
jgi:malic enzyme